MLLKLTSRKLERLPHSEVLIKRLQKEYETLLGRINDFAQVRRQWVEARKVSVMAAYDLEELTARLKKLRTDFHHQKRYWLVLNEKMPGLSVPG